MEYPLISVIIPIYNVEKYLDRCLESIVYQDYRKLEVILVDDGSTDSSARLADEWVNKDDRVVVFHKANGGLSDARNYGLEKSHGEYIVFVDSDDWIPDGAISHLVSFALDSNADFCYGDYIRKKEFDGNAKVDDAKTELITRDEFLDRFFKLNTQENVQFAWGKIYKRELFKEIRFPVGMTDEDVPTTFNVAINSNKIGRTESVVYNYYVNENSITESKFGERNFDLLKAWDLVLEIAEKKNCSADISEKAQFNRDRADFGILVNLAQSANYKRDKVTFAAEKKAALARLRKNYRKLLRGPIPKSRKVFILGFVISYPVTAWFINTVSNRNRR